MYWLSSFIPFYQTIKENKKELRCLQNEFYDVIEDATKMIKTSDGKRLQENVQQKRKDLQKTGFP